MRNNGHFPISLFNIIKVIRLYKEGKKDVLIAIDIAEKDLDIDFLCYQMLFWFSYQFPRIPFVAVVIFSILHLKTILPWSRHNECYLPKALHYPEQQFCHYQGDYTGACPKRIELRPFRMAGS